MLFFCCCFLTFCVEFALCEVFFTTCFVLWSTLLWLFQVVNSVFIFSVCGRLLSVVVVLFRLFHALSSYFRLFSIFDFDFDFEDDSHQRDARHSSLTNDRRAAETAHKVCTVFLKLHFQKFHSAPQLPSPGRRHTNHTPKRPILNHTIICRH